jgi:hypothetical protein
MFDRGCRGYEAVRYIILLPASAIPGWPAEVPLPVDPKWKNEVHPVNEYQQLKKRWNRGYSLR